VTRPPIDLVGTSTRTTLIGVARHSLPSIVEATLVPSALFYAAWMTLGPWAAYTAARVWGYGALARRLHRRSRVPGILIIALLGLTVRSVLALATGSAFVYFAQPILATGLVALLFLGSTLTNRPFVARVAADFYPMTAEVASRLALRKLFRRLTLLWAGVQLINAAAGASLLLTLPTSVYVPTKTASALLVTAVGVTVTVLLSLRVARREGLVAASPAMA
jgi:hypothetical protein